MSMTRREELIKFARMRLVFEFKMKDLDMMHYFLGMEVWQNAVGISPGQGKYIVESLKRFKRMDYKAMITPMGSNLKLLSVSSSDSVDATMYFQMIYLKTMRPDICFAVNTLRHVHLMVARHAVRYLKGIVEYGLKYDTNLKINLEGYVDSYWVGSAIDRKRTSRC